MAPKRLTRDQRRDKTRRELLDAAASVFPRHGYHGTSLDEIAEEAGYTKGAVYSHFKNKEDLFLALVDERQGAMVEQFFAAAQSDSPGSTTRIAAIGDVYRHLNPTEDEWILWNEFFLYSLRHPDLREKLRNDGIVALAGVTSMVEHMYAEEGVELPIPAETLARIYIAIFDGLARQRVLGPEETPDELFAEVVTFVNDAVRAMAAAHAAPT